VALGQIFRRVRAEHGFPMGQGAVLGALDREGPQSTSDLAAGAKMRPQSMAQTVRELEDGGFVARRPDPHDGRRSILELTPRGPGAPAGRPPAPRRLAGGRAGRRSE
jgi:DNA-binding MarR family transcriptional regulator